MKKLMNESNIYITNIITAITQHYANSQSSYSELMHLYTEEQKNFFVDFGLTIVKVIHVLVK